jgi:hypothetical protein
VRVDIQQPTELRTLAHAASVSIVSADSLGDAEG